jgi:hypothetical protein
MVFAIVDADRWWWMRGVTDGPCFRGMGVDVCPSRTTQSFAELDIMAGQGASGNKNFFRLMRKNDFSRDPSYL